MSIHRREDVLVRYFEVVSGTLTLPDGLDQFKTKYRNRMVGTNDSLPAVALMDGDEENVAAKIAPRGRMLPGVVTMHPQLFIVLKDGRPKNEGVGEMLNQYRGALITAIASDEQLRALLGPNGGIVYEGAITDLKTGAEMAGEMQINFALTCPLIP